MVKNVELLSSKSFICLHRFRFTEISYSLYICLVFKSMNELTFFLFLFPLIRPGCLAMN